MGVQRNLSIQGALAVGLLLLFLFLPEGCTRRIRRVFDRGITPVQEQVLKAGQRLREGAATVRGVGGLAEENRRLLEEMVRLQTQLHLLESLEEENRRLRDHFGFHDRTARPLIAAQVVSRSIDGWWQTVRINKGSRAGVVTDSAVISSDGLVGRVTEVRAGSAVVLLISDPASRVSAKIARTGSFGVVHGAGVNRKGYPVAQIRFLHKDIPVRPGDAVVTSGLGGIFPRDIRIGYVDRVYQDEAGLYQKADIVPKAVLDLLDVVFVFEGDPLSGEEGL